VGPPRRNRTSEASYQASQLCGPRATEAGEAPTRPYGSAPLQTQEDRYVTRKGDVWYRSPKIVAIAAELHELRRYQSSALVLERYKNLTWHDYTRILSELSIKRNGARAWSSFLWIEQSPKAGGVPPLEMYTHILGILGKCGREWVGRAVFILDRMDRRRMRLDKVAFNAALNILGKAQKPARVQKVYQRMVREGHKPDVVTFTTLIAVCQRAGLSEDAWGYLAEMESFGIEPNWKTYTTLMAADTRKGEWEKAFDTFEQLRAGNMVDEAVINAAISALAVPGDWQRAWALVAEMKRIGIEPTIRTYNALMLACDRGSEPDRVLEVFWKARRSKRVRLQLYTWNILLQALGRAGRYDEMRWYRKGLRLSGHKEDEHTLIALLTACDKMGDWEKALNIEKQCRADGVPTLVFHDNIILSVFRRNDMWQEAVDWLRNMQRRRSQRPDAVSYSVVITCCQRCEQPDLALSLFDEMLEVGLTPIGTVFAELVPALERKGDWKRAVALFDLMKALDIEEASMIMAARQFVYSFPLFQKLLPPALIAAGFATVASGRATRRWVDKSLGSPPEFDRLQQGGQEGRPPVRGSSWSQ